MCFLETSDPLRLFGKYLVQKKYADAKKITIQVGSNGDLVHVGVMDMLRFDEFTIGHARMPDYGNPGEIEHFNKCEVLTTAQCSFASQCIKSNQINIYQH